MAQGAFGGDVGATQSPRHSGICWIGAQWGYSMPGSSGVCGKRRRLEGSESRNGDDVGVVEMAGVRPASAVNPDTAGAKRPRRMCFDEVDLLVHLDAANDLEKVAVRGSGGLGGNDASGVIGGDANLVRPHKDGGLAGFDREGELDVRAMARFAMASVKQTHQSNGVYGDTNASFATGSEFDPDDILTHLDDGYNLENGIVHNGGGPGGGSGGDEYGCGGGYDYNGGGSGGNGYSGGGCGGFLGGDVNHGRDDKGAQLNIRALASFARSVVKAQFRVRDLRERHCLTQRKYRQRLAAAKKAEVNNPKVDKAGNKSTVEKPNTNQAADAKFAAKTSSANPSATTNSEPGVKPLLAPLSDADRAKALRRLQQALGPEGLDECVCVSCDRLVRREESLRKEASDWRYMAKMRRSFGEADTTLPIALRNEYTAPPCVAYLADTMVSPRSFHCYINRSGHWTAWFAVCNSCNSSIEKGCLPRFSITNGFYIGALPGWHAQKLTLPERFMTQLVSIAAMTRVMRGGRHRCIRSHSVVFDCTPGPPVSRLPLSISEVSTFRVAMVGDFTEEQASKVKKMHAIRGQRVREVFDFYRLNNCLYASVTPNNDVLNEIITAARAGQLEIDHIEDDGGNIQNGMTEDQANIRGHTGDWRITDQDDELNVVEMRLGLSDASRVLLSQELNTEDNGAERQFLVKRSNKLSMDVSGDLLAKMFPHLFPYGRGHPGEERRISVSLKECVKCYTMLSSRTFAEDELFTVVAFDRISVKNMYTQNSFRCQRFPQLYDRYEALDAAELKRALIENEQRQQGRRTDSKPKSLAHKFLKTVEVASAAVWGSNAERSKCRQKAIAYQTRFGQPSLFLTLTPNTDNSFATAYYAGKVSVNSLFDILEASLPSKGELREASLGNDSASARLFMYQVDMFIKHVLGRDPKSNKKMPFKGLLGDVKAYFGMVETQGRGTLHVHFLIWLADAPSSTAELERALTSSNGSHFRDSVISYIDSIVSNKLPLQVERYTCGKCKEPYSELVDLPIRPRAKQNPRRGIFSGRAHNAVKEPALVYCKACKTSFSSQHVLRSMLLQARPLHWPPWERQLISSEVDRVASTEAACRDTMDQAVDIVNEREKIQMALRNECGTLSNEYGLFTTPDTQHLSAANASQMTYCSSEDDPFQNDNLTRRIEMFPPTLADNRMGRQWMDSSSVSSASESALVVPY